MRSSSSPSELKGLFAASLTPLTEGGDGVDLDAIPAVVDFLLAGGVDGILALGTTGEGILLSPTERTRAAAAFVEASRGRLAVLVQCGAQTTTDTAALAAHAAEAGADGVSVMAPPYFTLDDRALLAHFTAAAQACAPLPFFVYEFAARSGYPVPVEVIERLREQAPNLAGLKVSDAPWERFEPYLIDGLDVFCGPEALIDKALEHGAVGAISALASAFPELVAVAVRSPSAQATAELAALRTSLERFSLQPALKAVLGLRGLPVRPDVRRPLRTLDEAERLELGRSLDGKLDLAA